MNAHRGGNWICVAVAMALTLAGWSDGLLPAIALSPKVVVLESPASADVYVTVTANNPFPMLNRPGTVLSFVVSAYASGGPFGSLTTATNVVVTETVPANTTFSAANSTPGWNCADGSPAGTTCFVTIGTLNYFEYRTFAVRINDAVPAGVQAISNTVSVYSPDDTTSNNNSSSFSVEIALWNLIAEKHARLNDANGNTTGDYGESIDYTIFLTNTGTGPARDVQMNDFIQYGFAETASLTTTQGTFFATDPGYIGQPLSAQIGTIVAGQSVRLAFRAPISRRVPSSLALLTNQASFFPWSSGGQYTVTNIVTTTLTPHVDLNVNKTEGYKSGPGNGGPIVFTITVQNAGSITATGVVVTETVPTHAALAPAHSSPGWDCIGVICTLTVGSIEPNNPYIGIHETRNMTFALQPLATMPTTTIYATNTVWVGDDGAHGPDAWSMDNAYSKAYLLGLRSPLSITKSVDFAFDANSNGKVNVGDTLQYHITVTNTGTREAVQARLQDLVSGACGFYCSGWQQIGAGTATASRGVVTATSASLDVFYGTLAPGEVVTASFRVFIANEPPFPVLEGENTAAVFDAFGLAAQSNTTRVPVARARDAQISKSMTTTRGATYVTHGDRVTFTLVVTNTGTDALQNVRILDTAQLDYSNHQGFQIVPGSAQISQGSGVIGGSSNNDAEFSVDNLASGAVVTASFAATIIEFPYTLSNIARVQWPLGYGSVGRNSNIISAEIRRGANLRIGLGPWSAALASSGVVTRSLMLYPNVSFEQGTFNTSITSAVITQHVPTSTTFDAANSAPGWVCNAGGAPNTACTFALGAPMSNTWAPISFTVAYDPAAISGTLRVTATTTLFETTPDALPDPDLESNVITTSIWFVSPVTISQSWIVTDTDRNGQISPNEPIRLQVFYTNTLATNIPPQSRFTTVVIGKFSSVNGSGFLTAPDGVFPPSNNPIAECNGAFGYVRGRIDPPIPPGFVVSFWFNGAYYDYGGPVIPTSTLAMMWTAVCDEYGTIFAMADNVDLRFVQLPSETATPNPTTTTTSNSTPTPTQTPTPSVTTTALPSTPVPNEVRPDSFRTITGTQGEVYSFDPGTFTDTVIIQITPLIAQPPFSVPVGLMKTSFSYDIQAILKSTGLPVQPTKPYTVVVVYPDQPGLIERSLALYYWTGSQWVKEPTSIVNTTTNTLTASPNHNSIWAIMGEPPRRTWLPMAVR